MVLFPGEKAYLVTEEGVGHLVWITKPSTRTILVEDHRGRILYYYCPLPYLIYCLNFNYFDVSFNENSNCQFRSIGIGASSVDIESWEDFMGVAPYYGYYYPTTCLGQAVYGLMAIRAPLKELRDSAVDILWTTTTSPLEMSVSVVIDDVSYINMKTASEAFKANSKVSWKIPHISYVSDVVDTNAFDGTKFHNVGDGADLSLQKERPKFVAAPEKERFSGLAYIFQHTDTVVLLVVKPPEVRELQGYSINLPSVAYVIQATKMDMGYKFVKVLVNAATDPIDSWNSPVLGSLPFFRYDDIYLSVRQAFPSLKDMFEEVRDLIYREMIFDRALPEPIAVRTGEHRIKVKDRETFAYIMEKFPDATIECNISADTSLQRLVYNAVKTIGRNEDRPVFIDQYDRQSIGDIVLPEN